jgi:hypothetical protein
MERARGQGRRKGDKAKEFVRNYNTTSEPEGGGGAGRGAGVGSKQK